MNKKTKILTGIIAIAIVICTIIAVYGIITAPKSDRQVLKEELANNEKKLEDDLSTYTPDTDDFGNADTENNTIDNNTIDNKRVDSHKAAGSFSYYSRFIFIHTTGIFHKALLRQHGLHLHYCQSL